jgi:hypothetical protein
MVPPTQIPTKKVLTLSFVKQISPLNNSDGIFGNFTGVEEQNCILKILTFDILRVPPIRISTKKG